MPRLILLILILIAGVNSAQAQMPMRLNPDDNTGGSFDNQSGQYENGSNGRLTWGRDSTARKKGKQIPIGQFQWRIDERLGTVIEAENNDTVVHNFQNFNQTDGYTGQYTILGNLGSPRINRIFMNREETDNFIFVQPFSHFRNSLTDFRFTNTKSPITNLAYHKLGSNQRGEDRLRAYFATNINKLTGIGFKLDYLYGRGYYNSQQNSMFGASVYGYHRGERYNMHAYFNANHMKMAENGGIENDNYIEDPQSFQNNYTSIDIPVMLASTWNRNDERTYYLTNRYHLGFKRDIPVPDSLKPKPPSEKELLMDLSDSIRNILKNDSVARMAAVDSLLKNWENSLTTPQEFVPVTSLIHTLDVRRLEHEYIGRSDTRKFYTHHFYGNPLDVSDETKGLSVRNTLGISQCEGFSKWAQMGLTAFASHTFRSYTLPELAGPDSTAMKKWKENDISVGGVLSRTKGKLINYNVNGEFWLIGEYAGDFKVDGDARLNIKTRKQDSIQVDLRGNIHHRKPGFYMRHYHSQFTWWDNTNLDRELRTRIQGRLSYSRTKTALTVGVENVTNYTHFAMENTLLGTDSTSINPNDYSRNVCVRQHGGNVQVFSAMLEQNFKLGPLHWDNEITYQKSSNQSVLPLPQLNAYTNLYLLFRIAKVLRVQLGGDMRYYTSYYAPDYSPAIGQFATQDASYSRIKIGNYPIINVYANLHLKNCRIYAGVNHVNANAGHAFWAPHYAINPLTFRFGLSWNFFN